MGDSLPRYVKHVLTAVDRLTLLPDYKVCTFYEKLAHPSPRSLPCTGAWERRLATPLPWPNIWSNIYSGLSTNWEADIVWRLAHGVVKTRAYLKRWQRLKVSDRCVICHKLESFLHAFCECTLAPTVWE